MNHFLWTDIAFLIVLIAGTSLIVWSLRRAPMRYAMRMAFSKPLAACSGLLLCFFLITGVLDSIHVTWDSTVHDEQTAPKMQGTLLDYMLAPVGKFYEKTYSYPLAIHLASKETRVVSGRVEQIYPRLQYMSSTMKTSTERDAFVGAMLFKALIWSMVLVGFMLFCWVSFWRLRSGHYETVLKKHALIFWAFLFLCVYLIVASFLLSRQLHVFGTGKIGEDIFYYALKSIRTALIIGILTSLFMLPLAVFLGVSAGYLGGFVDDVIQYLYTTLSAVPGVLLISASVLSMQTYIASHPDVFTSLSQNADARLLALCFILGVTSWTSLCRILRAETLKLRETDFVQAARALGSGFFTICYKHLIPNMMPLILITLVLDFSFLVLAEAVLSYVGVGVSPTTMSFGNLINSARLELAREPVVWWPIAAAFVMMFSLVLASNLVADAFREVFDPYGKKR